MIVVEYYRLTCASADFDECVGLVTLYDVAFLVFTCPLLATRGLISLLLIVEDIL